MNEEEKTQEVQEQTQSQTATTSIETQPEEGNAVVRAEKAAEAMKVQNDRYEELVKRNEKAMATNIVSGVAEAGQKEESKKEETDKEYADRMLKQGL